MEEVIETLANLTPSRQVLCRLTCAVRMSLERNPEQQTGFELVKTAYRGGKDETSVPSLSEALRASSALLYRIGNDRFYVYKICLDMFRHACEIQGYHLDRVFVYMEPVARYRAGYPASRDLRT